MSTEPIYGIDLGTTFTKCAVVRRDDRQVDRFRLDREASSSTSNGLYVLRSAITVGLDAEGRKTAWVGARSYEQFVEPDNDAVPVRRFEEAKIHIGASPMDGDADAPPWFYEPHDWSYRPEDVGAIVLRKVKQEVEKAGGGAIRRIVLTYPQYFTDTRRKVTQQAAEIAGLEIVATLTEPDAAAIAYGIAKENGKFMVFDLGGGTLNVTVAAMEHGRLRVIASDGLKRGGRDVDYVIFSRMVEEYAAKYADFSSDVIDDKTRQQWMWKAEQAKRALNDPEQTSVAIKYQCDNSIYSNQSNRLVLKRTEYISQAQSLIDACLDTAESALERSQLRWKDLEGIVCVGGSSQLAPLRDALAARSGQPLNNEVDVDTAVATGAALYGHSLGQRGVVQVPRGPATAAPATKPASLTLDTDLGGVLARRLGVRVFNPKLGADVIDLLVEKGQSLPHKRTRVFKSRMANEALIEVELYEGEFPEPESCDLLGKVEVPIPPGPAGQPVEVTIDIDANGTKRLSAVVFGQRRDIVIQFDPSLVSTDDELARRREFIESLRIV